MKKNSARAADPKVRVGELQRRTQDARKRAEAAKKEARDAKQRAREARRLFKEAKKVAKKARSELAALSKKLKKLIDGAPRARIQDNDAGTPEKQKVATAKPKATAAESVAKSKKSTRKVARPKQAKATKKKVAKSKSTQSPQAKANTAVESGAIESPPQTPRRSRTTRKSVTNGSVEAVVDATSPGDAPARTSEETVVESERQDTPEESAA